MTDHYVAGYDTAVLPVLDWILSSEWADTYQDHLEEFFKGLSETVEAPVQSILSELPTPLWAKAARSCFEDFLNAEYEATPSNALDQYLDEVGSELADADVDYLVTFRSSIVRVYLVVSRTPHESVVLRDIADGTREIWIVDETVTAALSAADHIATRIVTVADKDYLAGAILVLDAESLEAYKEGFESAFKEEIRTLEKYLQKDLRQRNMVRQRVLRETGPVVSGLWVMAVLATLGESAPFANVDDPETLFQAVIPYNSQLETIVGVFDTLPDLDRPLEGEFIWNWHTDRSNPDVSLKALVWISGPDICLESCEQTRLEDAVSILKGSLGDSIGDPRIWESSAEFDDIEDWEDGDEDDEEAVFDIPTNEADLLDFQIKLHQYLDDNYLSLLDSPVPELGGQVPRELAKTKKGQKQLSKWLVSLEDGLRSNADLVGVADYEFSWLYKELGMAYAPRPSHHG